MQCLGQGREPYLGRGLARVQRPPEESGGPGAVSVGDRHTVVRTETLGNVLDV